jgi:outer membrane protein assembly factor BamA
MAGDLMAHAARDCQTIALCRTSCVVALSLVFLVAAAGAQSIPIRSLTFDGNQGIDSGKLRSQLRISREGGWYHPDTLNTELQNLAKFYQDEGYLRAKVGPPSVDFQADPVKGRVAAIHVPISEGPLFTAGKIAVTNVQAFKPATLIQMCPLRTGQAYSRRKIAQWQDKIEDGYHTMGYIRFESTVHEEVHDQLRVVDCTLECKEGDAYSVGKITVIGDEAINRSDFRRHLLLGEGGLYNPELIFISIQFLNRMKVYQPIAESDVETKIDDARRTVDLIFHLALLRSPGLKP